MPPLEGKVALVTGAGRGIGLAVALALAGAGASLALFDAGGFELDAAGEAVEAAGARAIRIAGVVTDDADLARAVDEAVVRFGGIDILVNALSITGKAGTLLSPDEAEWERLLAVNLRAPRVLIGLVGRHMASRGQGGRIVSISSSSASRARGVGLAYGCSKAGIEALTRIAAAELAPHDISVNAVAPGVTATPLQRGLRSDEQMQQAVSAGPLENFFHRVSTPEDVAQAVLFLCGSGARQITAQVIHTSAGVVV